MILPTILFLAWMKCHTVTSLQCHDSDAATDRDAVYPLADRTECDRGGTGPTAAGLQTVGWCVPLGQRLHFTLPIPCYAHTETATRRFSS